MNLSELKNHLKEVETINFLLPDGTAIPRHFHITELGLTTKYFIDCGKSVHTDTVTNFQVYVAGDTDHRLSPEGMKKIIDLSESVIGESNYPIEVEFQKDTIGRYGLEFRDNMFQLTPKFTDCLAKDNCGIPATKTNLKLSELETSGACCIPGGGCC